MTGEKELALGLDIGSTTAKIVVTDGERILYSRYERHFSQVRTKALELIEGAREALSGHLFTAAISGSAGMGVAQAASLPFVQEVYATGQVVENMELDTSAVI